MENFGRPNWLADGSFFKKNYPDVEIVVSTTADASKAFQEQGLKIDYLHIDADHSFKGSMEDFDNYLPMMSKDSIMTFHDTRPRTYENVTCWKTLEKIRKRGFDVVDFNNMGAGVALIKIPRSVWTIVGSVVNRIPEESSVNNRTYVCLDEIASHY